MFMAPLLALPGALLSGAKFLIGTQTGRAILVAVGLVAFGLWSFNKGVEHEGAKCQAEAAIAQKAAIAQELETAQKIIAQQKEAMAKAESQESEDIKELSTELEASQKRIADYEKLIAASPDSACTLNSDDVGKL